MDYKKIIYSQSIRFKILKILKWVPDSIIIKLQYFIKFGRILNLKDPKRFTEKLQWYKLYHHNPLMKKCADKLTVREYVEHKGLKSNLNILHDVFEHVDDISFENLPDKYVIKTTHSSDTNLFCYNKKDFDIKNAKKKLKEWMNKDMFCYGREWCYKNISPKIIVEKLLENKDSNSKGINDYKVFCFNGKAKYIVVDIDRGIAHKRNFYDINWNYIDVKSDRPNFPDHIDKPRDFDEMLRIANLLAQDFPFARVDLYYVNSKIIFGELTFYPWTGYVQFTPDNFDFLMGKEFVLPLEI